MPKRTLDLVGSTVLLLLAGPLLTLLALLVFLQDFRSPFYRGRRVAMGGGAFGMVKFRSMRVDADRSGVMSTAGDDPRVTRVGAFMRRFKLDELPQLWNILIGDMSFVGPRPNVPSEVALYSAEERELLSVRPGVTDFASIVFADEGDVLHGSRDPDRDYNLLIRPGKSALGLHYVRARTLILDLHLMALTALTLVSRRRALSRVGALLQATGASTSLVALCRRDTPLRPAPPPGVREADWEAHLPPAKGTG